MYVMYLCMARISSVIGNLSHRKHYYNLLYFQIKNQLKFLKNEADNIGSVETFQQNKW
jgi:hypothetical protein